jgi:hypothetical protein
MRRSVRKSESQEDGVNNRNTVNNITKRIGVVGLCLGMVLLMVAQALADELNFEDVARARADSLAGLLVQEWSGARDPSTIRALLTGLQELGPPSSSAQSSLTPVLVGILDDSSTFKEGTQYLAVSQLDLMKLSTPSVIAGLEQCLARTDRNLPRLASGVTLSLRGYVQNALPVVEEYASVGWEPPDSLKVLGLADDADPVAPFLLPPKWKPLTLVEQADEDSLNAYFIRILAYPREAHRVHAIDFLLQKGIAVDEALDAAQGILENPEPCAPGDPEYAEQRNLLYILEEFGGARGRALAAQYQR